MKKLSIIFILFYLLTGCSNRQDSKAFEENTSEQLIQQTDSSTDRQSLYRTASPTGDISNQLINTVIKLNSPKCSGYIYFIKNQLICGYQNGIRAYDINEMSLVWSTNIGDGKIIHPDESNVYVQNAPQRIDAYDVKTGEYRWKSLLPGIFISLVDYNDTENIYVITGPTQGASEFLLLIINKTNGIVINTLNNITPMGHDFEISTYDKNLMLVYELGAKGAVNLFGWSPISHEILYQFDIWERPRAFCNGILLYQKSIVPPNVEAYDIYTGKILWSKDILIDNNQMNIYCNDTANPNKAFDSNTSYRMLFRYSPSQFVEMTKDYLLVKRGDSLLSYSPRTGEANWDSIDFQETGRRFSSLKEWVGVIEDEVLYSSENYNVTQAYDLKTHQFLWENPDIYVNSIVGHYEGVIVGLEARDNFGVAVIHKVLGIDSVSGKLLWERELGDQPLSEILVAGKWVIWNSSYDYTKNEIHFINSITGDEIPTIKVNGSPMWIFNKGNLLFVLSNEYNVFKIE